MSSRTAFSAGTFVGLLLLALLPPGVACIATTAVILVLGVPHGALDGEIARPLLKPRFGSAWFVVFALPYLALSALVLLAWRMAPLATLSAFLASSVWHFGEEDAPEGDVPAAFVRGGLPIALPVLLHPVATGAIFAAALQMPLPVAPSWLSWACLAWLGVAVAWVAVRLWRGEWRSAAPVLVLCLLFLALPPLTAFAIYFVTVHAPAHVDGLVGDPRIAPRVRDIGSALRLSVPITVLTLGLCAALWPAYAGSPAVRFLGLTLQVLSALTLPHILLGSVVARRRDAGRSSTLAWRGHPRLSYSRGSPGRT